MSDRLRTVYCFVSVRIIVDVEAAVEGNPPGAVPAWGVLLDFECRNGESETLMPGEELGSGVTELSRTGRVDC